MTTALDAQALLVAATTETGLADYGDPTLPERFAAAVEHLTALHHAYRAAYEDARAPAWAQAEWLDRWLPATLARLRDWLPGSCLTGTHTDDPATRYGEAVDDPVEFRARTQQDPR